MQDQRHRRPSTDVDIDVDRGSVAKRPTDVRAQSGSANTSHEPPTAVAAAFNGGTGHVELGVPLPRRSTPAMRAG